MIYKFGIRWKLTLYISLAVFLVIAFGLILEYFIGFNFLRKDIDDNFQILSNTLAQQISVRIDDKYEYLKSIITDSTLIEAINRSNMRYQGMSPDAARKSIYDVEDRWAQEETDSPIVREYLDNPASIELKKKSDIDKELPEVFITDRRGALVASSGKTSNFCHADEDWWINAFAGGKGKDYLGDVGLDQSSGSLSMAFAFPVKDSGGNVIGVARAVVDVRNFFSFLSKIRIGRTGRAALINEKGEIILKEGVVPLSRKILCDSCLKKTLIGTSTSMLADICDIEPLKKFRVFHAISNHLLMDKRVIWRVVVSQDMDEALRPLYGSIIRVLVLVIVLVTFTIPLSYFFGSMLTSPIKKLHKAADMIKAGEINYRIDINTGDEIEGLAEAFRAMAISLKQREEKLGRAKLYTDSIISSMADSLIALGLDGSIKFVNRSATELLGYSENEMAGSSMENIIINKEDEGALSQYLKTIYDKGSIYNVGLTFVSKYGKPIPVNLSGAVMREDEDVIGVVCIARDMRPIMSVVGDLEKSKNDLEDRNRYLTRMQKAMLHIMGDLKIAKDELKISYDKLKVAQDKIVQSEKEAALGRFSTGIAHEVKNPLAMVLSGAEFLEAKLTGVDENIKQNLMMVRKSAVRANDILESILLYIRPSSLKIENTRLDEIADEAVQLFKMQSATVKTDISSELEGGDIHINIDKMQMHQVLFNIIKNAIEASPEYGKITVKTGVSDSSGIISVIDHGSGMSKEALANMFEPFFSTKRPGKGTGLGLAMAKTIMDRHSGKLIIESEEGVGTTVKVVLPLVQA